MQRSVERVNGVRSVEIDLNTGRGEVIFRSGQSVTSEALWQAIKESGFTPVRVEMKGEIYEGPEQ